MLISGPMDLMRSPTDPILFLLHQYGLSPVYDTAPNLIARAKAAIEDKTLPLPDQNSRGWPALVSWLGAAGWLMPLAVAM